MKKDLRFFMGNDDDGCSIHVQVAKDENDDPVYAGGVDINALADTLSDLTDRLGFTELEQLIGWMGAMNQ